jgi:hypothetical protein
MTVLRTTLLSDGSSDRTLIPILDWLLQCKVSRLSLQQTQWADWRNRRVPPRGLEEKIRFAVEYYPSDLLFVHRDAERQSPEDRRTEILNAVHQSGINPTAVCIIPVRMTEAWLLLDEAAIRSASGNPRGRKPLNLPTVASIERVADPKETLFQALKTASEQTGRRLRDLRVEERRHRVAELMNWELLRSLSAFQTLEAELTATLEANDWV